MGLAPQAAAGLPGVIVASIAEALVFYFALKRYYKTSGEDRWITYPSIVVAIGLGSFGFSSLVFFLYGLTAFEPYYRLGLAGQLVAVLFLSIACFLAIQKYWGIAIVVAIYIPGDFAVMTAPIAAIYAFLPMFAIPWIVLSIIPIIVFGYLTVKTKRTTITGLFIASALLLAYALLRATIDVNGAQFYWVNLLAHGTILVCFLYPERPYGMQLLGYAGVIMLLGVEAIWLLMFYDTVDIGVLVYSAAMTVGVAFAAIGATHMEPRVRRDRHLSTVFVWFFFIASAVSGLLAIMWRFEAGLEAVSGLPPGALNFGTLSWYLALFAAAFMTASALYAMEWRTASLLPFIPIFASFIVSMALFPNLRETYMFDPAAYLTYQATLLISAILFFIPVIMYLIIGRRLPHEAGSGRGRAFGLSLGLILLLPAGFLPPPGIAEIIWLQIQGVFIFAGYATLLAAVIGLLDRLLYRSKGTPKSHPGKGETAESEGQQPAK